MQMGGDIGIRAHTGSKPFEFWHLDSGETSPPFVFKRALLETYAPQGEELFKQEVSHFFACSRSEIRPSKLNSRVFLSWHILGICS